MATKSILCIFNGLGDGELSAVHAALILGKSSRALIRFLHISPDPTAYAGLYSEGIIAVATVIEAIEEENTARLKRAKREIISLTGIYCVPLDVPGQIINHASARFIHRTGYAGSIIAQEGRLSDIVIMGRGAVSGDTLHDSNAVAALFNTGRPVLLVPNLTSPILEKEHKTIAIAWKGTVEAARAVYSAMPLLETADKVIVLTAAGHGERYDLDAEVALMEYLRTHGVDAKGDVVTADNCTPAEALLTRAKQLKADLLVMGAYGHSRFREVLFGGVTQHMLEKADIPLFLSH